MKKIKSYIIISACILTLGEVSARAQDMLNDYLLRAADNNPSLKARFNEYMAALEVVPQVGALPDPQLAFGYFIQPVRTRVGPQEFRISATQMFPWFGSLTARENVATQNAKAKYELFEEARSKLFDEAKGTYYNLYFNKKAITIVGENIRILKRFQNLALVKIETGKVSSVDEYRIEMEIGDLENQLALLRDNQHYLLVSFKNLLNTEVGEVILPDTLWNTAPELSRQTLLDSIMTRNHQLLGLEMQREAYSYKQEAARKSGKPDFSVGFDYIIVGKGENNLSGEDAFMFPRIGITIPLYRDKYRSMIQEATYQETAVSNEKQNRANMLETLFERTWNEFQDADRRLVLYEKQQDLASKSIDLLEVEYATADKNFEEILRMERKFLHYALELEKARADKQAAVSFIDYLMGK
jgi:cobalt-zinc-cadmium efflux system outer membrane protein